MHLLRVDEGRSLIRPERRQDRLVARLLTEQLGVHVSSEGVLPRDSLREHRARFRHSWIHLRELRLVREGANAASLRGGHALLPRVVVLEGRPLAVLVVVAAGAGVHLLVVVHLAARAWPLRGRYEHVVVAELVGRCVGGLRELLRLRPAALVVRSREGLGVAVVLARFAHVAELVLQARRYSSVPAHRVDAVSQVGPAEVEIPAMHAWIAEWVLSRRPHVDRGLRQEGDVEARLLGELLRHGELLGVENAAEAIHPECLNPGVELVEDARLDEIVHVVASHRRVGWEPAWCAHLAWPDWSSVGIAAEHVEVELLVVLRSIVGFVRVSRLSLHLLVAVLPCFKRALVELPHAVGGEVARVGLEIVCFLRHLFGKLRA